MRNSLKRRIGAEEGKVLVLVLAMLVVGGLVLAPLLGMTGTGLASGRVYERKAAELYAADAGVEDGIWKLQNPDVSGLQHGGCADTKWTHTYPEDGDPSFVVNGKNVVVVIEYLGDGLFKITSTASDNGSSTTILSWLQGDYLEYDIKMEDDDNTYPGTITDKTVYAEGDLTVEGSIEGGAVVYVVGNLEVEGNIEDGAHVYVKGDLVMEGFRTPGNIEDTAIVCVGGDLYVGHCSEDDVEVYVEGNLIGVGADSGIENGAAVCVERTISIAKIQRDNEGNIPSVCAGYSLTVTGVDGVEGGYLWVGNTASDIVLDYPDEFDPTSWGVFDDCELCSPSYPECGICCECPLQFGKTERQVAVVEWTGWRVTTYLINPQQ